MKSIILFLVAFIAISLLNESKAKTLIKGPKADPLAVGIFYNPYDSNSITFIGNQAQGRNGVCDLMMANQTNLEIDFVPWSNLNTGNANYSCPGEEDCLPTRLHACAIAYHQLNLVTNHQIFHFIVCTVTNDLWLTNASIAVDECIVQVGEWPDEFTDILICAKNHPESDQYLDEMKQQAANAAVTQVPWVTFDGTRNPNAETDLKSEVCNSFGDNKPDACSTSQQPGSSTQRPGSSSQPSVSSSTYPPSTSALPVNIFYTAFDDKSIAYIKRQGPDGDGVWDLMLPDQTTLEIDFVPGGIQTVSGNYTCPGEQNCLATRLHACAITYHQADIITNHQIFHFIYCTMSNKYWKTYPALAVDQCINQIGEWPEEGETLLICALNLQESNEYLEAMIKQTQANGVTYVPWVTFNGQHNKDAESDLKSAVCDQYGNNKPEACSTSKPPGQQPGIVINQCTNCIVISFNDLIVNFKQKFFDALKNSKLI